MLKKIRETIDYLKNHSRQRSLLILGLYIVFFAIVIVAFSTPSQNNEKKANNQNDYDSLSVLEKYNLLEDYQFMLTIDCLRDEKEVLFYFEGEVKDNIFVFSDSGDNQYYLENDNLFVELESGREKIEEPNIIEGFKYQPHFIFNLIDQAILKFQAEDYENNTMEKQYKLDIRKLEGYEESEEMHIYITTIEDEEKIKEVNISFENPNEEKVFFNNIKNIHIIYTDNK